MKALNSFFLAFLFAFAILSIIKPCFAASKLYQPPLSEWTVTILNYQKNSTLTAHCKSKNDDLGEHVIGVKGEYDWTFTENIWSTTLFWCNFQRENGHASFEVFWPEKGSWLQERCDNKIKNCIWVASDSGFYLTNIQRGKVLEFVHPWIPNS